MDQSDNVGIRFTVRQYVYYAYLFGRDLTDGEFRSLRTYEALASHSSKATRISLAQKIAKGDPAIESKVLCRWRVRGCDGETALSCCTIWLSELRAGKDQIFSWSEPYSEELLRALRPYYAYLGPGCDYVRLSNGRVVSIHSWLRNQEDDFRLGLTTEWQSA